MNQQPDSLSDEAAAADNQRTSDAAVLTPQQLEEAKRYGRLKLINHLTAWGVDLIFLCVLVWVLGGQDGWLMRQVSRLPAIETLRLGALYLLVALLNLIVEFPFSFYGGFVLEHRFKLSRLSLRGWAWRYVKETALQLLLGMLLVLGIFWLIWTVGSWWWLLAAAGMFAVGVLGVHLTPVLIMPMFNKIERLDDAELLSRMQRLAEGTGLSIEGVYRINMSAETVKANAQLAGMGTTRRVILGDTLLSNFNKDEIEVVMAHEIGHHVYRHLIKLIVLGAVFSAGAFWLCDWLLGIWLRWSDPALMAAGGEIDYAQFPIHALPMFMLIATVLSTLFTPLPAAISRHFERQCDRYALTRTGKSAAFKTAFRKLARINKDDPVPNPVAVALFHSHPPISERLAMADEKS